jgi:hypothetical protein
MGNDRVLVLLLVVVVWAVSAAARREPVAVWNAGMVGAEECDKEHDKEEWVQVVGSASVVELALLVEWAAVLDLEEELVEDWVVAVVQDLEEAPASEVEEEWVVAVVSEEEVAREAGLAPERV